jgi:hypothetical protein
MNSFRIGMIGVLVHHRGIEHAEGFLHFFEGWVIFGACIAILFAMAWSLQRLRPAPLPFFETLDLDSEGLLQQFKRIRNTQPSRALISSAVAQSLVSAAFSLAPSVERVDVARDGFTLFPGNLGPGRVLRSCWSQRSKRFWRRRLHRHHLCRARRAHAGELLHGLVSRQTEGQGLHSPEVCLPVGGWEIFSLHPYTVSMPGTVYGTLRSIAR